MEDKCLVVEECKVCGKTESVEVDPEVFHKKLFGNSKVEIICKECYIKKLKNIWE